MKYIIITLVVLSISIFANDLKWVDEQIQAIKPPRTGVNKAKINSLKTPFIYVKSKDGSDTSSKKKGVSSSSKSGSAKNAKRAISKAKPAKIRLILNAILNNSALINGKWYKTKDKIGRYTLQAINKTDVILQYKSKTEILTTDSRSKNIKFKNQ